MQRTILLVLTLLATGCAGPIATREASAPVRVGVIAFNDFHGALEPPGAAVAAPDGKGGTVMVPAGGAAWLASAIDSLKARHPNNVVVAAGDLTGASQFASSIHLDEPAVGVLNRIGLEFAAVGNHEFDRGRAELLRLQNGGCEKLTVREPCQLEQFEGAGYSYLAASTLTEDGSTLFPATGLKTFGKGKRKVTVGFVGLALKGTPELVDPNGISGLTFTDEADTINAAVPRLKAQGADAVIVLIHEGGQTIAASGPNGCDGLDGALIPILDRLDPRVDVVVSGHTHRAYVCDYPLSDRSQPLLLTSAGNYGQLITEITLEIDPHAGRVAGRRAANVIVQSPAFRGSSGEVSPTPLYPSFEPDAEIAAYVNRYTDAADVFAQRPVGRLSGPADRAGGPDRSTGGPLGNLIADAQLAATRGAGAQLALTNPFGIRAPLVPASDGSVTFAQLYAVQPFSNPLITQTMTGADLKTAIEEGLDDTGTKQMLTPSSTVRIAIDMNRPSGDRVITLEIDDEPVVPAASYRVTVNGFLAGGGDGFTSFTRGTDKATGMTDIEAFEAWFGNGDVRQVPMEERITQTAP